MTVQYAVTFEFDTRPPVTHRGTVQAGQPHVCMARATKAAHQALRPVNWSSAVCVLLERLPEGGEGTLAELVPDLDEEVPDLGELGVHPIDVDQGQDDHQETDAQEDQRERR